jgi:hypothetical protein
MRTQLFNHRLRKNLDVRRHDLLWFSQISQDFSLALTGNLAIAKKGRQSFFVSKILARRRELFGRLANCHANLDERISKAVWVVIRDAGVGKSLAKYRANGRSAAPMVSGQTHCHFERREDYRRVRRLHPHPLLQLAGFLCRTDSTTSSGQEGGRGLHADCRAPGQHQRGACTIAGHTPLFVKTLDAVRTQRMQVRRFVLVRDFPAIRADVVHQLAFACSSANSFCSMRSAAGRICSA